MVKIDKMTSRFDDVEGYCNCGVDGYYYFKMNFEDDGGLFSNFEAYIIDDFYDESDTTGEKEKHIAYCTFSDNLHEYQKIFVDNLKGFSQVFSSHFFLYFNKYRIFPQFSHYLRRQRLFIII